MEATISWFLAVSAVIMIAVMLYYVYQLYKEDTENAADNFALQPANTSLMTEFAEEIVPFPEWEKKTAQPTPELPYAYNQDYIMLMVRDPHWLYTYWEVTATKEEAFKAAFGEEAWFNSRPVLRVYDITGVDHFDGLNSNYYYDIYVNYDSRDCHIEVAQPSRSYCVDFGRMLADGRFITLLRSNFVTTPRQSLSDLYDEDWACLEGIYQMPLTMQYTETTNRTQQGRERRLS